MDFINLYGILIVILILIPNIVFAIKVKNQQNLCKNKLMSVLEQIGRYSCMFLMSFNVGIAGTELSSKNTLIIYLLVNSFLLLAYFICWISYFNQIKKWNQLALAIIPGCIFLFSGIMGGNILLCVMALIFAMAHIYVTVKNFPATPTSENL